MSQSWYKNSMPKIRDIKISLPSIVKELSKISSVKKIYVWGSFLENEYNDNFPIRDLDIIVSTNINSGDLLSVDKKSLFLSDEELESLGYNPKATKFTTSYTNIKTCNIDHWAISKDKKLIHWGPTILDRDEWNEIKKEAESYAKKITGKQRFSLKGEISAKWRTEHDHHINMYLQNMPKEWNQSDHSIKELLMEIKDITDLKK